MAISSSELSTNKADFGKYPKISSVIELLKPVTWFPPMWAFLCGAISSGVAFEENWLLVTCGIVLAGPLVCAMSQAINDWHDRFVDMINEPDRPIPSGRIPGKWGLYIACIWTALSLLMAVFLGVWVLVATVVGLFLAWAYSAPPFRLKKNGWMGNMAVAISYEGLAWFTGAAVLIGSLPDWRIITLALLYSIGAHGIMTLNDFKSVHGDSRMGIQSLPVQMGEAAAAKFASFVMAVPQVAVITLLVLWDLQFHALMVTALLIGQIYLMFKYLLNETELTKEPNRNAALYNATGTTLYVIGMMICAFGIGGQLAVGS